AWNQISPGLEKIRIVIAGKTKDSGQKIHNLTAAWRNDERYGEIIAFADADSLWDLKTLRNLVIPLKQRDVGLCTGYRWIVPEDHAIPSILASVINGSVSTALGPSWRNSGWGGAMAIRRTLFDNLDIPGFWQGKLNDDVSLTRHLQNQRLKVSFAPGVTPVNLVKLDWLGLIAFGRRQYIQLWHYHFLLWFYGVLITSSNVHCWIIAIILIFLGNAWGLTFAGLVFVSDMCRALARRRVVRSLLPEWAVARLNRVFWFDFLLTPFWYFVHYCLVWSTLFSRRLKWSGITYEISSNTVRVISRVG
ncbi:MAG: glycosyltransferase, partial [Deltaproteobacteria bacterium]|nr:glycosyltransferase [Deltaproteobacteria bacterium]